MKKQLLLTTALVALVSASNTYAQTMPDLTVSNTEQITGDKGVAYNTITVEKGGELTLEAGNVKTSAKDNPTTDITINGTLNLSNKSVLEAGSDNDDLANNSNMLLNGASVNMSDSDLEANGNITIKNTTLESTSTMPEEYGIWADGDITLEGGETTLSNSYLASGGNMTIQSGTINGSGSSDIRLSSDGQNKHKLDINGGNITLEDYAGIYSSGKDGQYNTLAADININGGNITVKDGREITLTGNADMNIGGNANITMDYSEESAGDDLHNGGILHEGQNGDINISGGVINLTGEVAKIERGGYDGDWIYSTTGKTLMSEDDFYKKTGKYLDQASDEEIQAAGLNPAEIDKNQYHVSSGDINISGGEINLKDGARISLTEKNTGDLNISGGKINLTNASIKALNGAVNILDGNIDIQGDTYSAIIANDFSMKGGTLTASSADGSADTGVFVKGNSDIELAGDITLTNSRIAKGNDFETSGNMNISGGKITLNKDAYLEMYDKNTGNINMTGGELVMYENSALRLNTDEDQNVVSNSDKFIMNGSNAKLTVNGGNQITGDVDLINGLISVADRASLSLETMNIKGGTINSDNGSIWGNGDINISGGTLNLTNPDAEYKQSIHSGAGIFGSNVSIDSKGKINISAGEVNLNQTSMNADKGIEVSGGIINLESTADNMAATLWSKGDILLSGGTINANNAAIDTFYVEDGIDSKGNITIAGATINILEDNSLTLGSKGEIKFDSGTINIAKDGALSVSDKYTTDSWNFDTKNVGTLLFGNQAVINLNGGIEGNVNGNGTINVLADNTLIKGNVNMTDGGVMNVGLNDAVIEGDAIFNSGSTLKLEIADSGNGSLTANTITGKEGSKLALNITKKMELNDVLEDVVLFNGNVTNNFTEELSNNRYSVQKNSDGKSYDITYIATASDIVSDAGGTASNASTAEAWDGMTAGSATAKDVSAKLKDLSENDSKGYVDALTAVAPEVAPMVQHTQTETANQVFGAVGTRLSGGSISTGGEGMASGDSVFERAAMWVQGLFNKSKLEDTSKSYGFDADSNGVAMGFEKNITDTTKLGIGYAYTNTDIDGFMRSTDVDTHTAIVYGEYKPSNWYVNGIASYGWSDYEEDKNVSGIGVKSDYDVESFGLQAMTGYDMQVKGFGLTPEVGLRYVHISQDGYTDSADQKVSGNDSDILTGVIGAKVSKNFALSNGMMIKPEARIAATYDLFNDDASSVVSLANGSAYTVEGEALDRFGMEFGAGVTAEVNDNVEFSLGYEGKFREDYQDHTGLLNAKYKF